MNKDQIKELEKETSKLFNKYSFQVPRRILPNILFEWMTPMYCFKTRIRTMLSELKMNTNFRVTDEGRIITDDNQQPILLIDDKEKELTEQIKKRLLLQGIDLTKF